MKTLPAFKIQTQKTAFHGTLIYIDEDVLLPTHYFSPEEKKAIASIHADHIQDYATKGLIMPIIIILNMGVNAIVSDGSCISRQSIFTKENGGTVDVQTLFSASEPHNEQIKPCNAIRYIRFNGVTYV
ncbi:MAG: hypothetical protein ACI9TY_000740 [Alphaproteobacteria bacterium]|jgi:hypothetical protein